MQVLYKDEEGFLAVMEVTKAAYIEDEELMEICGPEEDIAVAIDAKSAEILEKMAYFPVQLVSGISLYSAWRQPKRQSAYLHQ